MLCARVMRGISSMAKQETPVEAKSAHSCEALSGSPKPTRIWPGLSSARSERPASGLAPRQRTCATRSASRNSVCRSTIRAPRETYASSGYPASAPAPLSINTSIPNLRNASHWRGLTATRRSPGNVSRGVPRMAGNSPPLERNLILNSDGKSHPAVTCASLDSLYSGTKP